MNIDDKINLYFFNPLQSVEIYRELYISLCNERYQREQSRVRFAPLYLLRRDIRHCLNLGKEFNPVRANIGEAIFPAIILIRIAFTETVKKILAFEGVCSYQERIIKFGRDYLDIKDENLLIALGYLRDSLEHSNYSLYCTKNGIKYYFSLGYFKDIILEKDDWNSDQPSKMFLVNPKKLYSNLIVAFRRLHHELKDKNNTYMRNHFDNAVQIEDWTLI